MYSSIKQTPETDSFQLESSQVVQGLEVVVGKASVVFSADLYALTQEYCPWSPRLIVAAKHLSLSEPSRDDLVHVSERR